MGILLFSLCCAEDSIPIWYAEENEILSGGDLIEEDIIPSANILQLIDEGKEKGAQSNDVVETTAPNEAIDRVVSRSKRSIKPGSSTWPGGVVHYAFSAELRRKGKYATICVLTHCSNEVTTRSIP